MTVYFARSVVCAATAFAPSCSALCIIEKYMTTSEGLLVLGVL